MTNSWHMHFEENKTVFVETELVQKELLQDQSLQDCEVARAKTYGKSENVWEMPAWTAFRIS